MRLVFALVLGLLTMQSGVAHRDTLEVFPKYFVLRPGEQIHYTVIERLDGGQRRFVDASSWYTIRLSFGLSSRLASSRRGTRDILRSRYAPRLQKHESLSPLRVNLSRQSSTGNHVLPGHRSAT